MTASGMNERDERKSTFGEASKVFLTTSKPEVCFYSGKSVAETCILATRCPVYRRRDSHLGFRTELENLVGDANGKGTRATTRGRKY
jgi:hypothetical protein